MFYPLSMFTLLLVSALLVGCGTAMPPTRGAAEPDCLQLSTLRGLQVGVKVDSDWVQFGSAGQRDVVDVSRGNTLQWKARDRTREERANNVRDAFPRTFSGTDAYSHDGRRLGFPAMWSPDGRWLAAVALPKGSGV